MITARVSSETKAKFQALAAQYGLTESGFLKTLINRTIETVPTQAAKSAHPVRDGARAERLYVRLYPDDRQLLAERAAARAMPSATYLAVLARSHLRHLSPLPEPERKAFERGVAELAAIGRNINQIARRLNQEGVVSGLTRSDVAHLIKVCTGLLGHFKETIKANKASWAVGYETSDR